MALVLRVYLPIRELERCLKAGEKLHKSRIVPPFVVTVARAQLVKRFAESLRTHQKISFRRP